MDEHVQRSRPGRDVTVLDRRSAFIQLARILMHNGGLLADITVVDCVEAYRAQTGYANARQHSLWYALLRDDEVLVRVHAAAVNAREWHIMRGDPYIVRLASRAIFGFRGPRRKIRGSDVAGRNAVGVCGRNGLVPRR